MANVPTYSPLRMLLRKDRGFSVFNFLNMVAVSKEVSGWPGQIRGKSES